MIVNTALNFQGNEIKLATAEKVSSFPTENLFIGRLIVLVTSGSPDTGDYYRYNGIEWVKLGKSDVEVDTTLSYEGKAADAKATGDLLNQILAVEEGQVDNLAEKSDTEFHLGFGELKATWTFENGYSESGGTLFNDWNSLTVGVTPGETYYINWDTTGLSCTYFSANNFTTAISSFSLASNSFTVPNNPNIAYVNIPVRGAMHAGLIVSKEPISRDSGEIDNDVYVQRVRYDAESLASEDPIIGDGVKGNHSIGPKRLYPRTCFMLDTNNYEAASNNHITDNTYRKFITPAYPSGTDSAWRAFYRKKANCDYAYTIHKPRIYYKNPEATVTIDDITYTGYNSYGLYENPNIPLSDNYVRNTTVIHGYDIIAKSKDGQYMCFEWNVDSNTGAITYGIIIFRYIDGSENRSFVRSFCNARDPVSIHLTNYGYLKSIDVSAPTDLIYDPFNGVARKGRIKKRLDAGFITFTANGETTPFLKFSIDEIKNIIDTYGTVTLTASTQEEVDTWVGGTKEYTYRFFDFDFNISGIIYWDGNINYSTQYMYAFISTTPIHKLGADKIDFSVNVNDTEWRGKKWYAYGTSMTDSYYKGYAPKLAAISGMELHNYGKGGSGIIPSLHGNDSIKTRCMRTTDGKTEADLITIEIIPNDLGRGTLGNPTDTGDDTFCGNLNQILQYLQTNTTAQIVVLLATRSRYGDGGATQYPPTSSLVTTWIEWAEATKKVCERNVVQCWDGSAECGLGYYRVTGNNTYVQDQIHLTDTGAYNLAQYFFGRLKTLPLFYPTYPG